MKKVILLILVFGVLIIFWKTGVFTILAFILSGPIGPDDPNVAAILSTYPEFRTAEWDWTSDCISIVKPEGYEGKAYRVNPSRFICVGTFYYSENAYKYFNEYRRELKDYGFREINESYFKIKNIKDYFTMKKDYTVVYTDIRDDNVITVIVFNESEFSYLNETFFWKE